MFFSELENIEIMCHINGNIFLVMEGDLCIKKHTEEQYLYCIKNLFAVFFVDVAFGDSLFPIQRTSLEN